ncbi:MAG TPA: NAD(P)-dependent alcohol dehydrogenase [Ornithinimicrobium sp.]|uniref:NAD(P)-dependent alcohol dehydrogenase n=1 Tax=Ornithinimicrobium sp. TaxID=1977084 RepID=UPI002B4594FF|nr:NAD(P)-dependent alcohol dehydrogenase [Ornithinimicrobium sp.]HKJ12701.1 NAD(P)-dependent alcohol dehydrogenase [Ornithinimicrobium sp.]
MKAVVHERYGVIDSLRVAEVPRPQPAADELLVQVRAASVHPDVWHVVAGRPSVLRLMGSGVRRPRQPVPGTDVAGVVEAVGAEVTRFTPGDEVFGETLRGHQWRHGGAYAEYATLPEEGAALKPGGVGFEEASAVPTAGLIALANLPQRRVPQGLRVLVNGAAGGVGAMVMQLAKAYGAEVTGVDHERKLGLLQSLGADRTIDYTREDFTRSGERWDLIVDVPGNHAFTDIRRALVPDGHYILIGHDAFGSAGHRRLGSIPRMLGLAARSTVAPELRGGSMRTPAKAESMATLANYLATAQIRVVVDRTFALTEVPDALRYLASGLAVGRVVVRPEDNAG